MKLLRRRSPLFAVASLKEKTSLFISCFFIAVIIQPAQAKEVTEIPRVQELNRSARTVKEWLAQIEQQNPLDQGGKQESEIVQVTSVKANPTDKGVEVILQTSKGQQLQVVNRSSGNNFITDIPNAQLRLPSGDAFTFRSEKPIAGVSEITVTNFDAQTIRVSVTGETGVPIVELFDSPDEGIIFSVASSTSSAQQPQQQPQTQPPSQPETQTQPSQPASESDEPIELVVTGEQDGYTVPDASTATLTDTPLRDIPQSIQVIPQQVIKDQGITRIVDAVRNVSGAQIGAGYGNVFGDVWIRGFYAEPLVDGFTGLLPANGANIEQVEVLKGPASVLYGEGEAGGLVNYVTKKPLDTPYYSASFTAGSYDYYNPTIDLSGPLTTDKKLLYRLNVSYENSGSYRDYIENDILYISPVLSYKISDATTLDFTYEYLNSKQGFDRGFIFIPPAPYFTLPRNRLLNQPDDFSNNESHRLALTLNQQFGENWRLRSRFSAQFDQGSEKVTQVGGELLEDGRTLTRGQFGSGPNYSQNYALQTNLIGKFNTGAIAHQLLLGLKWQRNYQDVNNSYDIDFPSINIFEPNYNVLLPPIPYSPFNSSSNTIGIYLQDQVTLLPNLKLVLGGRYDFLDTSSENFSNPDEPQKSSANSHAFSPRVGIVYQPIEPISLYASYNRSFVGNLGTLKAGRIQIEPSLGTQYEVGIRAELFEKRLSANLAAYNITKTNIPTTDPNDDEFSIAIGEVKSRGIELDVAGEILPGWKVIASGFLNDAYVSKGYEELPEGRHLTNAPYHGASLWTSYEFQKGNLQGLQFGAGLFFKGDRTANIDDPFTLPSYVTTDALISYKRDNWQAALNFKNIFNVKYYESNDSLVFPQAPFTLQGTISVTF
ncbi:TonB-dependent siderophore receptor [Nostoc sp. ChiQUE01b]|uniref:TonB-dependent siderophore receptor n=1 Tax=Nostoc sp. ChiQUE01b TaxID=3075376 RepID=UPI002AD55D5B|nr:TonB-dependent siderophore receptor [Nostoc sp. ChiQUE01b]MDZ8257307.1 TonB-dependent siderophore receptor [Nostoc sp. ChiQUE01b]